MTWLKTAASWCAVAAPLALFGAAGALTIQPAAPAFAQESREDALGKEADREWKYAQEFRRRADEYEKLARNAEKQEKKFDDLLKNPKLRKVQREALETARDVWRKTREERRKQAADLRIQAEEFELEAFRKDRTVQERAERTAREAKPAAQPAGVSPARQAFQVADEMLAQAEQEAVRIEAAGRALISRPIYENPGFFLPERFASWKMPELIKGFQQARKDLRADLIGLEQKKLSREQYLEKVLARVRYVVPGVWDAHLRAATAENETLTGDNYRLKRQLDAEYDTTNKALIKRFGISKERDEGMRQLRARQSQVRKGNWDVIVARYRALRDELLATRTRWAGFLWRWHDFHASLSAAGSGDFHTRTAAEFKEQVYKQFAARYPDGREVIGPIYAYTLQAGSKDRFLFLGFDPDFDDFCSRRPYPDVQIYAGTPSLLRWVLTETPVEKLRTTAGFAAAVTKGTR